MRLLPYTQKAASAPLVKKVNQIKVLEHHTHDPSIQKHSTVPLSRHVRYKVCVSWGAVVITEPVFFFFFSAVAAAAVAAALCEEHNNSMS